MLYCDRIDLSQGIDVSKTSTSKECNICHYWYFFDKGFKFQLCICNECHDALIMSMDLSDITMLYINGVNYCCIINGISKSEANNLMQNIAVSEKKPQKTEHYKI